MPTKLKLFRKAVAMILGVWLFAPSLFASHYHTQGNRIVDKDGNPAVASSVLSQFTDPSPASQPKRFYRAR